MASPRNDLLDRLVYLGLRVVSMAVHSWGIDASLEIAKAIGTGMYLIDKKHRDRALGNLRRSFPEMPEKNRRVMARRSMQALVMLAVEVLFTTRLIRIDTFAKYVELGGGFEETLQLLLKREQGLIMLTGHYGNWEILGYVLATLGFPTVSIARPLDNPYVSDFVFGVREKTGQRIIAKKGATDEVVDVLDHHGVVGFIADQNAGSKGVFVDFFGRKASTYKSIALLAMQYEVPVVIGYARRINDRFRFECASQDIIYPADWKDQPDPLRYITQRYTKAIEDFVRADPGQYLWVHRRWKTRPKGEAPEAFD
jgi:KDO2-lipid IV(A) lauroyltransferase